MKNNTIDYDINSNKIDPSQLNNFSLEKLYNKGNFGVIENVLRNGYSKYSVILEENFSSSPSIITEEGYYKNFNNFNDVILTDMSYSTISGGKIERPFPNTSPSATIEIRQIEKSEKLPEFFAIFMRLGLLYNKVRIDDENLKRTFDSNKEDFIDNFNNDKYISNKRSYITFYNEINPNKIVSIPLSSFFNTNKNDNNFFDGIITRDYLLSKNIPEELNNNRLIIKINFGDSTYRSYGFFISLIQLAYSAPNNYPPNDTESKPSSSNPTYLTSDDMDEISNEVLKKMTWKYL